MRDNQEREALLQWEVLAAGSRQRGQRSFHCCIISDQIGQPFHLPLPANLQERVEFPIYLHTHQAGQPKKTCMHTSPSPGLSNTTGLKIHNSSFCSMTLFQMNLTAFFVPFALRSSGRVCFSFALKIESSQSRRWIVFVSFPAGTDSQDASQTLENGICSINVYGIKFLDPLTDI